MGYCAGFRCLCLWDLFSCSNKYDDNLTRTNLVRNVIKVIYKFKYWLYKILQKEIRHWKSRFVRDTPHLIIWKESHQSDIYFCSLPNQFEIKPPSICKQFNNLYKFDNEDNITYHLWIIASSNFSNGDHWRISFGSLPRWLVYYTSLWYHL